MKKTFFATYLDPKILFFPAAIFGFPIIALFVQDASISRQITIPYRAFIFFLSIFLVLQKKGSNSRNEQSKMQTKESLFLSIFICIYSFRVVYDLTYNNLLYKEPSEYFLNWFGICLIPGIYCFFLDSKHSEKYLHLSWILLYISSILALLLIFQEQGNAKFSEQGRLAGESLNPISLGHQSASMILVSIYNLLKKTSNDWKHRKYKLNILSLIIGVLLLFSAASKGPVFATLGAILCYLISLKKRKFNSLKIVFTIIAFCIPIILLASSMNFGFLERLLSFLDGADFDDTNFIQRPELYKKTIKLIANNTVLGYALEIPDYGYPHNLILEAFLTTGVLGGSLFVMLHILAGIKAIMIIMDENNSWGWLGLIYIQYAIGSMFSGSLYGSNIFWYLLFAILGMKKNDYKLI